MNYTNITLFGLGVLGILLHNLVELNKLNKAQEGRTSLKQYLTMERFAILISLLIIIVCIIAKSEILQLEQLGHWLGLGFMAIGYMGQSLLIFFMSKANKAIGKDND